MIVKRERTKAWPYEVHCGVCGPQMIRRINDQKKAHTWARAHVRETGHSVYLIRTKTTLYWLDYEIPPVGGAESTGELVIGNTGELRIR